MKIRPPFLALAFTSIITLVPSCTAAQSDAPELQINLASYHNPAPPTGPDTIGFAYNLPSNDTLDYFHKKGFRTVKLPMNWVRLQPKAFGPLSEPKLAELDDFMARAKKRGFRVVVNLCAFGGREGHQLGSKELPTKALAAFWLPFVKRYRGQLAGYDIMNEPHDMPNAQAWPVAAQETVDAIRTVDRDTVIYVEGDDWASAQRWIQSNGSLNIKDPAKRLVYSAHIYFDKDTSGLYKTTLKQDAVKPSSARDRLMPFVLWLRTRGFKGHIGEVGVPHADVNWLPFLQNFLNEAERDGDVLTGVAYWAGGDWTDSWNLTVQPATDGKWTDRPQMKLLTDYLAKHPAP